MPDYDFRSLSPVDFEHLSRDVLNADLGLRLQSYPPGRDQGIDLRQVDADGMVTVVQCKHYVESSWSTFLRAVEKEGKRGKGLAADRYLFITSRPLTPLQQGKILGKLTDLAIVHDDIWGKDTLNAALGRHREVERRHVKLWISSTEVLDTLLHSGQWQRGEALLASLADRAKLWVHTPAYDQVLDMLEREGICIVSGPPGIGKSFLAGMALLAAAHSGWQVVDVANNIEEAWTALRTDRPQIFHYDDFLGEAGVELAKNEPRSLNAFLDRVRKLKESKRIILTTREHELRAAAEGPADELAALARNPARYQLRLEAYDLQTRARILFNHLYFSDLPAGERDHLAVDSRLLNITRHPAYNPRIISVAIQLSPSPTADEVLDTIGRALENPQDLWNGSFRRLSALGQQVLLTMATLPCRPWPAETIRRLVASEDALAWTPALRTLETTWLQLMGAASNRSLSFANPGCRNYMLGMLDDTAVADRQLDRVASRAQLVSMSHSAGLIARPDEAPSVARAELASMLANRRADVLETLRRLTLVDLADEPSADRHIWILLDAAAVLKALGAAADTAWLFERAEALTELGSGNPFALQPVEAFELAEMLHSLPAEDPARPSRISKRVALAATWGIAAIRDLDAYEALPADLAHDADVRAVFRERAQSVVEAECAQLLQEIDNARTIEVFATDLGERAKSYGFDIDIGPILDRADEMAAEPTSLPDWPRAMGDSDDSESDTDADLHQTFMKLGADDDKDTDT
jgi:Restriction endonuclease